MKNGQCEISASNIITTNELHYNYNEIFNEVDQGKGGEEGQYQNYHHILIQKHHYSVWMSKGVG